MELEELDDTALKLILKTSEGFPSQVSQAKVVRGKLSPSTVGHALGSHLRGASSIAYKTKFLRLDDMVKAFRALLGTSQGRTALRDLKAGARLKVQENVDAIFGVECDTQGLGKHKFTPQDQRNAGCSSTSLVAILEGRDRGGRTHLHVQTFYPRFGDEALTRLLDAKAGP